MDGLKYHVASWDTFPSKANLVNSRRWSIGDAFGSPVHFIIQNPYVMNYVSHLISVTAIILTGMIGSCKMYQPEHEGKPETFMDDKIKLPKPVFKSNLSIEEAIHQRRSARSYKDLPMTLGEVSQLLWSAQGITDPEQRYRTAPSAGALYPLEVYAVISNVMDVSAGVYHYKPFAHRLEKVKDGNMINELAKAALSQTSIIESAMTLVMTGVYERTTKKYDERGIRYVYMEAGHAAQNIYLQAESLELGLVVIGAFNDKEIGTILNLPEDERPLYIIPVGKL